MCCAVSFMCSLVILRKGCLISTVPHLVQEAFNRVSFADLSRPGKAHSAGERKKTAPTKEATPKPHSAGGGKNNTKTPPDKSGSFQIRHKGTQSAGGKNQHKLSS
jgi:hypothetical protein